MTTDKEQRLLEAIQNKIDTYDFWESQDEDEVIEKITQLIKSNEVGEYWQSQQQETPELEEIRKEWDRIRPAYSTKEEDPFNFFAPYINGTDAVESDAIEFHNWLLEEVDIEHPIHTGEYFCYETQKYHDIGELYDLFKSLPKAPKEVQGE